jgi:hypothetical protein
MKKERKSKYKLKHYHKVTSMKEQTAVKDIFLEKVLKSKLFYWSILVLVLIYLYQDDRILNIPTIYFWIRFLIAMVVIGLFLFFRYNKFKAYYKRKFKDKIYLFSFLGGILIFSLIGQSFLNIPLNLFVKEMSKQNAIEIYDCEITNVITTSIDKIHFKFLGKGYSRYFNVNNFKREDLMHNYYLEVKTRRAFNNIYYIESMSLKKKDSALIGVL